VIFQKRCSWSIYSRIAIGIVVFLNLQCAIQFMLFPETYTSLFELSGIPGEVAIKGFAVLFLMWNVPYIFALIDPYKNRISYIQAVTMQAIGLIGESIIYFSIPAEFSVLQSSVFRFLIFDAAGLVLLATGFSSVALTLKNYSLGSSK
jgi:hypothetical protein